MRWLLGLPLLPLLICGAMCIIPAALVALGLRRRDDSTEGQAKHEEITPAAEAPEVGQR